MKTTLIYLFTAILIAYDFNPLKPLEILIYVIPFLCWGIYLIYRRL